MNRLGLKCKHCGVSADWLIWQALLIKLGGKVYPEPTWCSESPDNKHELLRNCELLKVKQE